MIGTSTGLGARKTALFGRVLSRTDSRVLIGRLGFVLFISVLISSGFCGALAVEQNEEIAEQARDREGDEPLKGSVEQGEKKSEEESSREGKSDEDSFHETGVIYSDQLLRTHNSSGQSLLFDAECAKRRGDMERALTLAKRSVEMDTTNLDAHCFYADLLESKLKKQSEKDPEMFRTCVKEWLSIFRDEIGDDKGLTWNGIGIPGAGTFYEDEEHTIRARQHLVKLTGAAPKAWETNTKYLKRVLTHADENVSGKVIKARKDPDEMAF